MPLFLSDSRVDVDLFAPTALICGSVDAAFTSAINLLVKCGRPLGSRDGESTEILGWSFLLRDLSRTLVMNAVRALDPYYACGELLWYLSGDPRIDAVRAYAPQYERFAENGVAWGAYGCRLAGSDLFHRELAAVGASENRGLPSQLAAVAATLVAHPESRQAVVALWNDGDLPHAVKLDKKDMPCTLTLQFFLRNGRLHLEVNMRSNDVWLGLPYDVFCFTSIQRLVAHMLDVRPGLYHHKIGSLHLYDRDRKRAEAALEVGTTIAEDVVSLDCWQGALRMPTSEHVAQCIDVERRARSGETSEHLRSLSSRVADHRTIVSEAAVTCMHKWFPPELDCPMPHSSSLKHLVWRTKEKAREGR